MSIHITSIVYLTIIVNPYDNPKKSRVRYKTHINLQQNLEFVQPNNSTMW